MSGADASRVVGYGAFALEYAASARLAETDRERLLSACMTALRVATQAGRKANPKVKLYGLSPTLSSWRATFVTLTENERLRGCIGSLKSCRPLIDDAVANTAQAGFADPRFPPLKESELTRLRLDVSILSHPRPIPATSEFELAGVLEPDASGLAPAGQAARPVPAERLAPSPRRARVRALLVMAKAGFESNHSPGRTGGETLPRRIVRGAMAAD